MNTLKNIIYLSAFVVSMMSCSKSDGDKSGSPDEQLFSGDTLKVMTYNIYSGQKKGFEAIANVIKSTGADIIALEEVESQSSKFNIDVVAHLSELTDMPYYYFAKAINLNPGGYGNAILSKFPITNARTVLLDKINQDSSYLRSLGLVKVKIKEGQEVYVGVTHLDVETNDNRVHQLETIHQNTVGLDRPVFLAGDFNAHPTEIPITYIKQFFTLGCLNGYCGYTAPAPKPGYTIDYIMYTPSDGIRTLAYDVDYDAYSESDHFPVIGKFIIK